MKKALFIKITCIFLLLGCKTTSQNRSATGHGKSSLSATGSFRVQSTYPLKKSIQDRFFSLHGVPLCVGKVVNNGNLNTAIWVDRQAQIVSVIFEEDKEVKIDLEDDTEEEEEKPEDYVRCDSEVGTTIERDLLQIISLVSPVYRKASGGFTYSLEERVSNVKRTLVSIDLKYDRKNPGCSRLETLSEQEQNRTNSHCNETLVTELCSGQLQNNCNIEWVNDRALRISVNW